MKIDRHVVVAMIEHHCGGTDHGPARPRSGR